MQEDSGLNGFMLKGFGQIIAWMVIVTAGTYELLDHVVTSGN
jgi:hypothetical protein